MHEVSIMVTTIKITCDGVFIQSNSYLTREHHRISSVPARTENVENLAIQKHAYAYTKSNQTQTQQRKLDDLIARKSINNNTIDKEIISCERVGHDEKFTISFLNLREPVSRTTTSDINNNNYNTIINSNKDCDSKHNKCVGNNLRQSINKNNSCKRQLDTTLSASSKVSNKSHSTSCTSSSSTKVKNIG